MWGIKQQTLARRLCFEGRVIIVTEVWEQNAIKIIKFDGMVNLKINFELTTSKKRFPLSIHSCPKKLLRNCNNIKAIN